MSGAVLPKDVVVSKATGTVYVPSSASDNNRAAVSLLTRDMAGMFVETLSEQQISLLMRRLKIAPVHMHRRHGGHGIHGEDENGRTRAHV